MAELVVFVSHGFGDDLYQGGLGNYRDQVDRLFRLAAQSLVSGVEFDFELAFVAQQAGSPLPPQVRADLERCDLALVDLTGNRLNVMYELGWLHGKGKPVLLVRNYRELDAGHDIPADIADLLVSHYGVPSDLVKLLAGPARTAIAEALESRHRRGHPGSSWFPADTEAINIVCAPEPEQSRFADLNEPNYLYVDNLEDRDALLEVTAHLSRRYPARLSYATAHPSWGRI